MGLDIVAYRNIRERDAGLVEVDSWGDPVDPGIFTLHGSASASEQLWPGRSAPFTPGNTDGRFYSCDEEDDFRAGSYSTYNGWRSLLDGFSEFLGDGSFEELVDFSDCEGLLGTEVSEKLFVDFRRGREKLDGFLAGLVENGDISAEGGKWFSELYDDFMHAFELARVSGAVVFC